MGNRPTIVVNVVMFRESLNFAEKKLLVEHVPIFVIYL